MPHLISQRDSHPVCDGGNGIKKKTPSGSISALMSQWGQRGVGQDKAMQTSQSARSGPPEQMGCSQLHTIRRIWTQLFLQDPLQETNVPTLHACPADINGILM